MAVTLKAHRQVTQTVMPIVPDYYPSDDTKLGKIVDILTEASTSRKHGNVRERLFDDDADVVESCIRQLDEAYVMARKIIALDVDTLTALREGKDVPFQQLHDEAIERTRGQRPVR